MTDEGGRRVRVVEDPDIAPPVVTHNGGARAGTFAHRVEGCRNRIAAATAALNQTTATHAAAVRQARAAEQAALATRRAELAAAETELAATEAKAETFRNRVATGEVHEHAPDRHARQPQVPHDVLCRPLDQLSVEESFELLQLLGVPGVGLAVLRREGVTGAVLADLTNQNMEQVFKMHRRGDRRRLANTLRGLANRGGFPPPLDGQPGALGWNADRVTQWLREDGLGDLAARFAEHGIDGECLLKLQPDDLKVLGATTLGQQSNLKRRLDRLRKLTYAGQMVGPEAAAAALAAVGEAGAQIRTVLAAVLDDNAALQDRIQQLQDRPAAAAIPDQFQCPILGDLMHDPVIAMDGHTYERAAIETWFQRSDRSPMTNLPIPPTLIPNIAIRQQIAALDDAAAAAN